jgi:molybdopterin/thiamine biosynthesis adenylyltransferase
LPGDERYSRQVRFAPIGESGQASISSARVGVVGLGALGTVVAEQLVRAGVGYLRTIDRDLVELSNLQRQTLYDEDDARKNLPKAVAAERRLKEINSSVTIDSNVDDLNVSNVEDWLEGLDLVIDGLDNFETRFVLNDACRKQSTPWIYSAAVGSYGLVMPVLPDGPCLRCVVDTLPGAGTSPTCDTAGVIAPITGIIASVAVARAMRLLMETISSDEVQLVSEDVELVSFDVWSLKFQSIKISSDVRSSCPLCVDGRFDYLMSSPVRTITMCGRNAVQLIPGVPSDLDLEAVGRTLEVFGPVEFNEFLLKCANPPFELTLFRDGRAIVKGTEEPSVARSLYSKMVGM